VVEYASINSFILLQLKEIENFHRYVLLAAEIPTHALNNYYICWFTFCLFLYSEYHVTCCMIFCLCFCAFTFRRVLLCAYLCKSVQRSEKPETSVFLYSEMDDKY